MSKVFVVFSAVVLVAISMASSAAWGDDRTDAVDELFRRWSNDHSPGATIAVIRDGRLLYSKGYGMANLEHDIENSPQSIFHVASVSKQFTAFAIFLLQDQGKLSLDDDLRKHLPEIHDCYSKSGRGWRKAVLSYAIVGATSLFTTAEDLAKWQINFESQALGSDPVFKSVFRKGVLNDGSEITYAGGVYYGKLGSHPTVGHSGGDAAYNCNIVRIPKQKLSVIVLANTSNLPTASLSNQIATLFLDDNAKEDPTEATNDPRSAPSNPDKDNPNAGLRPNLKTNTLRSVRVSTQQSDLSDPQPPIPVEELAGHYYCSELDVSYLLEANQTNGLNLVRRKYGSPRCLSLGENKFLVGSGIRMTLEFQPDPSNEDEITLFISSNRVKRLRFMKHKE